MGRFLTPSKIATLVLASIYSDGIVPLSARAAVLRALLMRTLPDSDEAGDAGESEKSYTTGCIFDLERSLALARTVWDLLLGRLWAIDCIDALETFMAGLPPQLGKTRDRLLREREDPTLSSPDGGDGDGKIVRTSPLGAFIRRCCLEYDRLQFQGVVALWMDLVAYRMPTKGAYTRRGSSKNALHQARQRAPNALDVNLARMSLDGSHPLVGIMFRPMMDKFEREKDSYSSVDAEKLAEFQASTLQKMGGRLPAGMQDKLRQMSHEGARVPKLVHYLRFLDSWRAGDFASALDNLHRYFDYAIQSRDRTFYQYALLNLAILQADFGCHDEAVVAMQEAIATAREKGDTNCLNYCLSWLYHLGRTFPSQMQSVRETGILGNEAEGLQFLKSRAKEAEMWSLLSMSLLGEAKLDLQQGQSVARVLENIVKSNHINVVKGSGNAGPTLLMKSAAFSRMGQTHMAYACVDRFLLCHAEKGPFEDVLKGTFKQAALLAQMGRPHEAATALAKVPPHMLKVLKYQNLHATAVDSLRARRLLHRHRLVEADTLIRRLLRQSGDGDIENAFNVALLEIAYLTRTKRLAAALDKIKQLADCIPVENNDVVLKAKLMTLKARLLAYSDKAMQGLSLTMRAMDLAYRARALPQLWDAGVSLGHILNEACEFAAAKDVLAAMLPAVLETMDCDLAGRLYVRLADSYMGLAGVETEGQDAAGRVAAPREGFVGRAMEALEKGGEQFGLMEELDGQLEVVAKMGRIFAWRGDVERAVEMGERYVDLKKRYEEEKI